MNIKFSKMIIERFGFKSTYNGPRLTLVRQKSGMLGRTKYQHSRGLEFSPVDGFGRPQMGCWVGKHAHQYSDMICTNPYKNSFSIRQVWQENMQQGEIEEILIPGEPEILRELGRALIDVADRLEAEGCDEDGKLSFWDMWKNEYNKNNPEHRVE